jgi:integrase
VALTTKRVRDALTAGVKGSRHFDAEGLALVVSGYGTGYWQRRYQLHGKSHEISLGKVVGGVKIELSELEQVRAKNKKISEQLREKVDPLAARRADEATRAAETAKLQAVATFDTTAAAYIAAHAAGWKQPGYAQNWQRSLRQYVSPFIGKLPIADITQAHVLAVLEQPITIKKDGASTTGKLWEVYPAAAGRLRSRIELIWNFAKARDPQNFPGSNPALNDVIKHALPPRSRLAKPEPYSALPFAEVPAFWTELAKREGSAARALQFLILTATRVNETLGARWDEIDLDAKLWTIPSQRMKGGQEHQVPLSEPAIALLKGLPTEAGNPFVFAGLNGPGLSAGALRSLLLRMRFDYTTHGFRLSFRDWAAENEVSRDVAEASLAHVLGKDTTERAYLRTKLLARRRLVMDAWGAFVTTAPVKMTGKVLPIRGRA